MRPSVRDRRSQVSEHRSNPPFLSQNRLIDAGGSFLHTDRIQFAMMQAYLEVGQTDTAAFGFCVWKLPVCQGLFVAEKLELVLEFLPGLQVPVSLTVEAIVRITAPRHPARFKGICPSKANAILDPSHLLSGQFVPKFLLNWRRMVET